MHSRSMLVAVVVLALLGACGSAQPPAGPKHEVTASEEAKTPCPKERKKAQEAREMLLDASDAELVATTARLVFQQGLCELGALASVAVPSGNLEQVLAGVRALRGQVQDASNLFAEVERYQQEDLRSPAFFAQAELKLIFSARVSAIATPADLDAAAATEFESELAESARVLSEEGRSLRRQACASLAKGASDDRCP